VKVYHATPKATPTTNDTPPLGSDATTPAKQVLALADDHHTTITDPATGEILSQPA
jgi:hypothetical protein